MAVKPAVPMIMALRLLSPRRQRDQATNAFNARVRPCRPSGFRSRPSQSVVLPRPHGAEDSLRVNGAGEINTRIIGK